MVIEDSAETLRLIKLILEKENYNVDTFTCGYSALDNIKQNPPDLIILDLSLPDIDGIEICKILENDDILKCIPIIMLTGRRADEAIGLNTGADDYIIKPFDAEILLSRINAVLRRVHYNRTPEKTMIIGDVVVNIFGREVTIGDEIIPLSGKEFDLFWLLMENSGKVLSKKFLLDSVWGYSKFITIRTVDTYICRIRKKLGRKISERIRTVQRIGYTFSDS